MTLAGDVFMDTATVTGSLDFSSAEVGGDLWMSGATVMGRLDLGGAQVDGELFMNNAAQFAEVDLGFARLAADVNMVDAEVKGLLDLSRAQVGRNIVLNGATVTGRLNVSNAQVSGDLLMRGEKATFSEVDLAGVTLAGDVFMDTATVTGSLDFSSAEVGGDLWMSGATVMGRLDLGGAQVDGELFMNNAAQFAEVDLGLARLAADVNMVDAEVKGLLDLSRVQVGGDLNFTGAQLSGADLRGAQVSGRLILANGTGRSRWQPDATLDLRNMTVGRLVARPYGEPLHHLPGRDPDARDPGGPETVRLEGFQYEQLGGSDGEQLGGFSATENFIKEWLKRDMDVHDLSSGARHSALPHEQFARVLREAGLSGEARQTLYEGKNHELRQSLSNWRSLDSWADSSWLLATGGLIGYGHRVWYALGWITLFLALGWWFARQSGVTIAGSRPERLGFWYSLDQLLPIIELRKDHYEVQLGRRHRVYFYIHSMMGYVLATFLFSSLSGLVG